MKYLFLSLSLLILSSCGSFKRLEVNEIRTAYIEYNPIEPINFGSTIEAKVMVIMNDGSELDVTNNRKLTLISEDIVRNGLTKSFKIVKHPTSFSENTANVNITITDKELIFQATDSIRMNFKGDLTIDAKGNNGIDGVSQKNRGSRLLLRDGRHGANGTHGTNGQSAERYVSNIWLENNLTHIYVINQQTNEVWRYKTLGEGSITFNLKGGNGGNGGHGGDGGNGRNGSLNNGKYKRPGHGGDGGHGGRGGDGGNGGTVHVTIHPNNSQIEPKLNYLTDGGNHGAPGKGGKFGKGGTPLAGQIAGTIGKNGTRGWSGRNGLDGRIQPLNFQEFSLDQLK